MGFLLAIIVLLSPATFGGHHVQTIEDFVLGRVEGDCDAGEYCSLPEIRLPRADAFASDKYVCTANQLIFPSGGLDTDADLKLYPFDNAHVDVYFPNDTDDTIRDGTPIRYGYACTGLK